MPIGRRVVLLVASPIVASPLAAAASAQSVPSGDRDSGPRIELESLDPEARPLTVEDAFLRIGGVVGRVLPFVDADGDGRADLVAHVLDGPSDQERLAVVSTRTGKAVRMLARAPRRQLRRYAWEEGGEWALGGDLDGDGVGDLLVGLPLALHEGRALGAVEAHSGKDGSRIATTWGDAPGDRYGSSVAFLGDVDGDGRSDYAVGAPKGRGAAVLGAVVLRSGRDGKVLWRADGAEGIVRVSSFGAFVVAVDDVDRDGVRDLVAHGRVGESGPVTFLSGRTGRALAEVPGHLGTAVALGDLDGDGACEVGLDHNLARSQDRFGGLTVLSGRDRKPLWDVPYPDFDDPFGVTVGLGDLDGDGRDDFAIGGPNFHLRGPGDPGWDGRATAVDLRKATLRDVLKIESDPWCAFTWESGAALLLSGRDRHVLAGVFGRPGSRDGVGLAIGALPDVTGDGSPDFVVVAGLQPCTDGGGTALLFAGPGQRAAK